MAVKCDECHFIGRFKSEVKYHKIVKHSDLRPWPCPFPGCTYSAKLKSGLNIHSRTHKMEPTLRKPFPCTFENCNFRAAAKPKVLMHIKAKHTPGRTRDFQCPMCPSKFFTKISLKLHVPNHLKEKVLNCALCNFSTHSHNCLNSHVKYRHREGLAFKCQFQDCKFSTKNKSSLRRHEKVHEPGPPLRCQFRNCDFSTTAEIYMKRHIRERHDPTNPPKIFICPLCSKNLRSKNGLDFHIQDLHTQETLVHRCTECDHVSKSASNLKLHWQNKHDDQPKVPKKWFYCKLCDYRAQQKHQVPLHVKTMHTGEREFKCNFPKCTYETNYFWPFKNHMLTHEENPDGQFPFACTYPGCDFRRRHKAQMVTHESLHETSVTQFKCKICPDKIYPDKFSLHWHECAVHDKRSYKCTLCEFAACREDKLKNHLRLTHNVILRALSARGPERKAAMMTDCVKTVFRRSSFVHLQKVDLKLV